MRFFNFEIFPKYENENDEEDDLKCSFCKKLLENPRITNCCAKNVCFSCWKENCRFLTKKGIFVDFKIEISEKKIWFICRLCSNMTPVPAGGAVERFEFINNYLSAVSETFQEKIDSRKRENQKIQIQVVK